MIAQTLALLRSDEGDAELPSGLTVTRISIDQELHNGMVGTVELVAQDDAADILMALRGQLIRITLEHEPLMPEIRALVCAVRVGITHDPLGHHFELIIRSPAELLRSSRRQRIFYAKSTQQIVREVFANYTALTAPRHHADAGRDKREYVVQFGESDWDFVRRLLADDGISLLTDVATGAVTCVDDTTHEYAGSFGIPLRTTSGLETLTHAAVERVFIETHLVPESTSVRAFDENHPGLHLEGQARARDTLLVPASGGSARRQRDWYEYEPRAFRDAAAGESRAQQLREELTREEERVICLASFALPPGSHLSVTGSPKELPDKLLVVRSRTEVQASSNGSDGVHRSTLDTVPLRRFRPARLPKPRIHGAQTAFVRGGAGQEIDVDSSGRIEVEFPWDQRDARSSGALRRVRIAHGWAGASYGMGAIPRVGDEVVVSFLDGDPDDPLVVGRVHNGAAPGPLNLPAEKAHTVWRTQSTPASNGFNEIRMVDDAGNELVKMHAQKDFQLIALHDADRFVGAGDRQVVGGPQDITVRDQKTETIHKGEVRGVGKGSSTQVHGPVRIDATSYLLTADERADSISGPWTSQAASYELNAGGGPFDLFAGAVTVDGESIHLTAGGCDIRMEAGAITIQVGGSAITLTEANIKAISGGSSIVVDSATITQVSPLIELNP